MEQLVEMSYSSKDEHGFLFSTQIGATEAVLILKFKMTVDIHHTVTSYFS